MSNQITTQLIEEQNSEETMWENNGGVGDLALNQNNQLMINVCKTNQNDKKMFDIYISLESMPQDRLLIEITQQQDFETLFMRIQESLEMKYEQFKGLKGLKVKEMKKQTMLQNIQKRQEIFIYNQPIQENLSKLESTKNELVIKSLKARDHIFVNIDAQDLWIKVFLKTEAQNEKAFESEFEIKVDIGMNGKELKSVL